MDEQKILLVEDERNVGSTLVEKLRKEGFDVTWSETAEDARLQLAGRRFDLVLLDVGLPDESGFSVAEVIKQEQPATAIVFLTAQTSPENRVRGLELGAEDYIAKPFHLKELILRIRNGLRRAQYLASGEADRPEGVVIGQARVRFARFEADVGGQITRLSHKETALLKLLVDRRGKVVSRDEILNQVWSEDEFPTPRTVDNFILRLRKLVEADPENPRAIVSVRGVGYMLEEESR